VDGAEPIDQLDGAGVTRSEACVVVGHSHQTHPVTRFRPCGTIHISTYGAEGQSACAGEGRWPASTIGLADRAYPDEVTEGGREWVIAVVILVQALMALYWMLFGLAWWASGQQP
jgi:hypothetical protein